MAFQQGLSGLNVAAKAIEITSNNIANSNTVGFKASQAHFSDVYAASLTGASAKQAGIGAAISGIAQQFTQGNITATANPLDLAINGQGFYRLDANGTTSYARNGQFKVDKDGYLINDQLLKLTGYPAPGGVVVPSTPAPILVSASDLAPTATNGINGGTATLNLDARELQPDNPIFDHTDPLSYNSSTAMTVYDSLGNPHTYTMYFVKTPTENQWVAHTSLTDSPTTGTTAVDAGLVGAAGTPMIFGTDGTLLGADGLTAPSLANPAITVSETFVTPGAAPLVFSLNFPGTTQFGNTFSVNQLTQNGFTTGRLAGLTVGQDGTIQGRYTNGQSRDLGQIVLANFTNPNGLTPIGNNQWSETSDSGPPLIGQPNSGRLGVIQAAAVEESNTDLTAELVNLITQQRNYQANAQSIRTQDQVLNTLVNLR